jgi:hypothetical protein
MPSTSAASAGSAAWAGPAPAPSPSPTSRQSREFNVVNYTGNDGKPHYLLEPVDGDIDFFSYTT